MSTGYCITKKKECRTCEHMQLYDSGYKKSYHCYHPSRPANPAIKLTKVKPFKSCKLIK